MPPGPMICHPHDNRPGWYRERSTCTQKVRCSNLSHGRQLQELLKQWLFPFKMLGIEMLECWRNILTALWDIGTREKHFDHSEMLERGRNILTILWDVGMLEEHFDLSMRCWTTGGTFWPLSAMLKFWRNILKVLWDVGMLEDHFDRSMRCLNAGGTFWPFFEVLDRQLVFIGVHHHIKWRNLRIQQRLFTWFEQFWDF